MKVERKAIIANGLFVVIGVTFAAIPATRVAGICLSSFMGLSLMFSGVTGYCGWVRILRGKS